MSLAELKIVQDDGEFDTNRLVQLAVDGCEEAFAALAEHFRPRLVQVLQRRLGGRYADAEDVTQDALTKAFYNLSRFDSQYRFSTWLYTIAFRVAQDHLRKNRRWFEVGSLNEPATHPSAEVGHSIESEELARNIWASAKTLLSADQYTALWLRYGEELDVAEIAQAMRKTKVGIRVLLHRARLIMCEQFSDESETKSPRTVDDSRGARS